MTLRPLAEKKWRALFAAAALSVRISARRCFDTRLAVTSPSPQCRVASLGQQQQQQ